MFDRDTFVKQLLALMRYAYHTEGRLPDGINTEEWEGDKDNPGLKQQMLCLANELRRDAFFAGYFHGALDAFNDIGPKDKIFMPEANKDGAWKRWHEFDKE